MKDELTQRLMTLAERGERLLSLWEQRYAPAPEPDWSCPAFRWRAPGQLHEVKYPHLLDLDTLRGIGRQKQELQRNTKQFVNKRPANNALLWGARGTGKSSLIKALLQEYFDQGLRLIEVDAHELVDLPLIVAPLYDRPERFIIFADDLSFEAGDPSYKALKAALDGSIDATPENVLIYATSNRRHLLPEFTQENRDAQNVDGEIHHGEAVEEKISLSERFGLWLSFYPFKQNEYLEIVRAHLKKFDIEIAAGHPAERAALQWALARGSRSGRVAWQFARDWAGRHG